MYHFPCAEILPLFSFVFLCAAGDHSEDCGLIAEGEPGGGGPIPTLLNLSSVIRSFFCLSDFAIRVP